MNKQDIEMSVVAAMAAVQAAKDLLADAKKVVENAERALADAKKRELFFLCLPQYLFRNREPFTVPGDELTLRETLVGSTLVVNLPWMCGCELCVLHGLSLDELREMLTTKGANKLLIRVHVFGGEYDTIVLSERDIRRVENGRIVWQNCCGAYLQIPDLLEWELIPATQEERERLTNHQEKKHSKSHR